MSDAIPELQERKGKLIEELDLIDRYLELHTKLFPAQNAETKSGRTDTSARQHSEAEKNDPRVVADMAEKILRKHGRPLQRGDLVSRIEASGLPIHSKDKNRYLGTILWRHRSRFTNFPNLGYWIKGLEADASRSRLLPNS